MIIKLLEIFSINKYLIGENFLILSILINAPKVNIFSFLFDSISL